MSKLLLAMLMGGALVAVPQHAHAASNPTMKAIRNAVICQCGCNRTLNTPCENPKCEVRAQMLAMARKEIAEGKDTTAILQDFVHRYGVKVLASPPAQGFNLTAWVLPGIGLLIGLTFVIGIVRRWHQPPAVGQSADAAAPPLDPAVMAAVEKEMKEMSGS